MEDNEINEFREKISQQEEIIQKLSKELDDEVDNFRYRYIQNYKICETFDVEIFKLFMFSFLQPYY